MNISPFALFMLLMMMSLCAFDEGLILNTNKLLLTEGLIHVHPAFFPCLMCDLWKSSLYNSTVSPFYAFVSPFICNPFFTWQVPKFSIERGIIDLPLLLGCSAGKLKPMLEQFDSLGVRTTKLGNIIATSPQLLLQRPEEFQKVMF